MNHRLQVSIFKVNKKIIQLGFMVKSSIVWATPKKLSFFKNINLILNHKMQFTDSNLQTDHMHT